MTAERKQTLPLKRPHMANNEFERGITFRNADNAIRRRKIVLPPGITMDGDGDPPLLSKSIDRIEIGRIGCNAAVIRVDLDPVRLPDVHCTAEKTDALFRGISHIQICKGIKAAL